MPEERVLSYRSAVIEAIAGEMRRDQTVLVLGEDVGVAGGVFNQTQGLFEEFGAQRVVDIPISESGAFGLCVGAAMAGARPIFEVMFADFITLTMDQLVNQAAKACYMSGGAVHVPLVMRTMMGAGGSLGAQHSQSLHAWIAHVPGCKVVLPTTAADAKGLYTAAIRDDGPVVIFDDRSLLNTKGHVPEGDYFVPLGRASVRREGSDVTIVALGRMVNIALLAADALATEDIAVEVIDPRTLEPFDAETIVTSVRKTNLVLVADAGTRKFGAGAEIAALIGDLAFDWLDAPIVRLGAADVPIPFSPALEAQVLPTVQSMTAAARALVRRTAESVARL